MVKQKTALFKLWDAKPNLRGAKSEVDTKNDIENYKVVVFIEWIAKFSVSANSKLVR